MHAPCRTNALFLLIPFQDIEENGALERVTLFLILAYIDRYRYRYGYTPQN